MGTEEKGGQKTAEAQKVAPATGKLGVMVVGLGAVATTMIAGVEAVRRGLAKPIGSLTQMGTIRLGKRTDNKSPLIKDFVPLADLNDMVFTGWDIFEDNVYESAAHAEVLDKEMLDATEAVPGDDQAAAGGLRPVLREAAARHAREEGQEQARPGRSVDGRHSGIQEDSGSRGDDLGASTEIFIEPTAVHQRSRPLRRALRTNDIGIAPSQIYAYAAMSEGVPFANGAPNLTVDFPAMVELSKKNAAPICGKDFKTGQTMMKTVLAPAFKARMLGVSGWFSTNILGNRDGEVLDDPESFKTKEESKLGSLDYIFQPELYPDLYKDLYHKIRINYYPPRGDEKEAWDNIDIFGWLGYPMQIKVNFLCRDSILAAPIALDLVLFMDLAKRTPELRSIGIQEWLSFYLKSPQSAPGLYPEHDLFIQSMKLKNTLRHIMGTDLITHLGLDYYD